MQVERSIVGTFDLISVVGDKVVFVTQIDKKTRRKSLIFFTKYSILVDVKNGRFKYQSGRELEMRQKSKKVSCLKWESWHLPGWETGLQFNILIREDVKV